tara:strand:- start:535 stop:960 length:426 start_codon:yes stop_codon:yes gene_type:complete
MSSEEKKRSYSLKGLEEPKELIGEEVVVPIETVQREARKIANTKDEQNKKIGEDFVPDAMKKGEPLEGKIIAYNEETRKYKVEIEKIDFPLYFSRNEIIIKKIENLKLTWALNRPNIPNRPKSDIDSDTDSDAEEVMKFKF